uniref:Uncharacterized protein n=1 Tax=Arundo donax TaxID=35708 RepID=A0A0A9AK37_ARUDO
MISPRSRSMSITVHALDPPWFCPRVEQCTVHLLSSVLRRRTLLI